MMNLTVFMGRLGRDVELRYTTGENARAVGRFSLGVTRNFKGKNGEYETDWIRCVAFGNTAEQISKYFHKGDMIAVTGHLQTGSYTNENGVKFNTTDNIVDRFNFCGSKKNSERGSVGNNARNRDDSFISVPDGIEEELPFA